MKTRPHRGFMDGDKLPCICRSICSAADDDDMEVLGIQARDALRYLQKKVAKSGCVGYADHSFVVALDSADQFGTAS